MPSHESRYGNFFEFEKDDIFQNTIKAHPKVNFHIYNNAVFYNNESQDGTNFHTPNGHINLYELNVNRNLVSSSSDPQLIYPFITKGGSFTSFSTISDDEFNLDFVYGDTLTGSYPLTASISVDRYDTTFSGKKKEVLYALKNSLDYHTTLSPHYAYSSSFGDKAQQKLNIVSIPSIFYGSNIQKGTVKLKYYVTGTTTGSSVGVVLYNEGFIILTSSANIDGHTEQYGLTDSSLNTSWHYFATTSSYAGSPSSSFSIAFSGEQNIQTLTLFAHAKKNQLNFSNNPTFLSHSITAFTGGNIYFEDASTEIKNIVSSSYAEHSASFQPITYISKVGIYDENRNLIAIAALANPVRKLENRNYTFKLKLDI